MLYVLEVYTAMPDKIDDVVALTQKVAGLLKKHPEKYKWVKSYSAMQHDIGTMGGFYEVWEFESLADMEKFMAFYPTDKDLKAVHEEFVKLLVPGSHRYEVVNEVACYKP